MIAVRTKGAGGRAQGAAIQTSRQASDVKSSSPAACRHPAPCAPRPAFTLVEMLVVITIIGILVSLGTVAIFKALEAAKRARIKVEITNLSQAIEAFKVDYKDYPPSYFYTSDPNSLALIQRFLAKSFPRCDVATELRFLPANGLTPAESLVFWLTSISKDPARPLSAPTTDRKTYFDFDRTRLQLSPRGNSTLPPGWSVSGAGPNAVLNAYNPQVYLDPSGKNSPFVYFEARGYFGHALQVNNSPSYVPACCPYLLEPWNKNNNNATAVDAGPNGPPTNDVQSDGSGNWIPSSYQKICANPNSFQIISAGLDGSFGGQGNPVPVKYNGKNYTLVFKSYPTGGVIGGYDSAGGDDDNLTNFSEGALGDAKP